MKINRIAIIAVLAILTVVLAGSASAFDLSFLTGSDDAAQDVNIGGIDFTIPAGFTENEDYKMDNETGYSGTDYYMNAAGFEDDSKKNAIYIMVADYGQYNVTDEVLAYVADSNDAVKKTINGHNGYFMEATNDQASQVNDQTEILNMDNMTSDKVYMFIYEENGDLVYIGATDESYLNEVIH